MKDDAQQDSRIGGAYILQVSSKDVPCEDSIGDHDEDIQLTHILRKVSVVLLPILFLTAVFAYLDKGNLSYAAIKLNPQLGFTATDYGLASGFFYLGFGVGILPSSFMTIKYGARFWFGTIVFAWGVVSTCHALINTKAAFFVLRILLGLAESGGATAGGHLLAQFYPQSRIALPFTTIVVSSTVSGIFAAPLAAGLMSMDGLGGLKGWQYLFIIEGIPSVVLGISMMIWLPSTPLTAWMLTPEERELLHRRVFVTPEEADAARKPPQWRQLFSIVWDTAKRPQLWYFVAVGFLWVLSSMSINSWLPILVNNMLSGTASSQSSSSGMAAKAAAKGAQSTKAILLSGVPSLCASVAMLIVAWHADRTNEKNWHVAVPYMTGGVLLALFTVFDKMSFAAGFVVLTIAVALANAPAGVINGRVVACLDTKHAAIGLAIYTTVLACLGGFSGPVIIGALVEKMGSFSQATITMGVILTCSGLLMSALAVYEALLSKRGHPLTGTGSNQQASMTQQGETASRGQRDASGHQQDRSLMQQERSLMQQRGHAAAVQAACDQP